MSENQPENLSNTIDADQQKPNTIDLSITTSDPTIIAAALQTQNQSSFLQSKSRVLPLVYFQQPPTTNKATTNVVFNTVQLSNINHNIGKTTTSCTNIPLPTNLALQSNQSVILGKSQQLLIQKTSVPPQAVVPITVSLNSALKSTVAYLTVPKTPTTVPPLRTPNQAIKNRTENVHLVPNMAAVTPNPGHKYVITPMPKVTSNRLPVTATTNCNLHSKIAFMPMGIPITSSLNQDPKKVYNFKVSNGQLQSDDPITVLCDSERQGSVKKDCKESETNERINPSSSNKELDNNQDKTYQLSIVEDSGSRSDVSYTISIPDESEKPNLEPLPKDMPKFSKQGISILKKSASSYEKKSNPLINSIPNSITTISDSNTKEVKISCSTEVDESVANKQIPKPQVKPERRRKANFSYRKDYDEVETAQSSNWVSSDKFDKLLSGDLKFSKNNLEKLNSGKTNSDKILTNNKVYTDNKLYSDNKVYTDNKLYSNSKLYSENKFNSFENMTSKSKDLMEVDGINQRVPDINDNFDESKVLNWEDGIGTLPGSNLKFQMNEFGFLEFLTEEDLKKILEKQMVKIKESKIRNEFQDDLRCQECGCFGLPSEFITSKYCSYDCQRAGEKFSKEKELRYQRKRKKIFCKKISEIDDMEDRDSSPSDEENNSNENSQDKVTSYPWHCNKKGFSWSKYLDHMKAKAAPVKLFKDPFPYARNGFRVGMKLEGIDPQHPKYFCVLTVSEVIGYRIRLHFDGYSENYDFWVNADSMEIFPTGWCEKNGHVLHPPPNLNGEEFNWINYLKQTRSTAAPKHLFTNRPSICPNGFRIGMKLEAVDKKNHNLVCVATVADMMDNRILVHFDSWDDIYDYWADPTSPYIHPVGWCDQNGHNLTPPNDYPHPETFTWDTYLQMTKSTPAPARAFKQRPGNGFKRGMRLECVDKRVPQLIRVATVDDVRDHQIRIKFDGWPDKYSYWVDDDSTDIHPIGWCQKTQHPLEPPLTPDDVYDFLECATVGCRGQGHMKGPKYKTHSSPKYCPYADENIDLDKKLPDRLLSPDREPESVVPVSREPKEFSTKIKSKHGRPPKVPRLDATPVIKTDCSEEDVVKKQKNVFKKDPSPLPEKKCEPLVLTNGYNYDHNSETSDVWKKHSHYLRQFINSNTDPRRWGESEVVEFVSSVPSCRGHSSLFLNHCIDGDSLLMLTQEDLVDILEFKLGPAIKLYNSIILLRHSISKGYR